MSWEVPFTTAAARLPGTFPLTLAYLVPLKQILSPSWLFGFYALGGYGELYLEDWEVQLPAVPGGDVLPVYRDVGNLNVAHEALLQHLGDVHRHVDGLSPGPEDNLPRSAVEHGYAGGYIVEKRLRLSDDDRLPLLGHWQRGTRDWAYNGSLLKELQ